MLNYTIHSRRQFAVLPNESAVELDPSKYCRSGDVTTADDSITTMLNLKLDALCKVIEVKQNPREFTLLRCLL